MKVTDLGDWTNGPVLGNPKDSQVLVNSWMAIKTKKSQLGLVSFLHKNPINQELVNNYLGLVRVALGLRPYV
jgi:hypothetical protein